MCMSPAQPISQPSAGSEYSAYATGSAWWWCTSSISCPYQRTYAGSSPSGGAGSDAAMASAIWSGVVAAVTDLPPTSNSVPVV